MVTSSFLLAFAMLLLLPATSFPQTELYYDDGSAEIGVAWPTPNQGAAVRFEVTPPVQLQLARIYVMTAQPATLLGIIVLAANGPGSSPGDTLFGPTTFSWNGTLFSWSEYHFPQSMRIDAADFYVAYYQTVAGALNEVPIIGQDQTGEFSNRSWELFHGEWTQLLEGQANGNVMIRAVVTGSTPILATTWGQLKYRAQSQQGESGP